MHHHTLHVAPLLLLILALLLPRSACATAVSGNATNTSSSPPTDKDDSNRYVSKTSAATIGAITVGAGVLLTSTSPSLAAVHSLHIAIGFLSCAPRNVRQFSDDNKWSLFPLDFVLQHTTERAWETETIRNEDLRHFVTTVILLVGIFVVNGALFLILKHACCQGSDDDAGTWSRFPSVYLGAANFLLVPLSLAGTREAIVDPATSVGSIAAVLIVGASLLFPLWLRFRPLLFVPAHLQKCEPKNLTFSRRDDDGGDSLLGEDCALTCLPKLCFSPSFWSPVALERRFGALFSPYRCNEEDPFGRRSQRFQFINVVLFVADGVTVALTHLTKDTDNRDINSQCHVQVIFLMCLLLCHVVTAIILRPYRHKCFNVLTPCLFVAQMASLTTFFFQGEEDTAFGLHLLFISIELVFALCMWVAVVFEIKLWQRTSDEERRDDANAMQLQGVDYNAMY